MKHSHERKPSWTARCASVLAVGVAVPLTAVALTAFPAAGGAFAAPVKSATDFYSSVEAGEPQPDWKDTVEIDKAGRKKTSGVNGGFQQGLPGNIMDKVVEVQASGENPPSETKERAVDGSANSKWLVFMPTGWLQVKLSEPIKVVKYALTSANDVMERDPKDWALQGSQDGQTWTDLDTRTGEMFADRFQTNEYTATNPTAYLYYRLNITANNGAPLLQLAELQLSDGSPAPQPPSEMKSFVSGGPVSGPNMMPNMGFTGTKALQYSGAHVALGRGYSYNKIFDVNLTVTPTTELSYRIFPELVARDLNYPSTYAAVDLAFSDGTYLSELGATDQHFAPLTPRGQGQSRTVYADQWNHKVSRIGAVAAGKTIDRILIAYDNPKGTGLINGWVDDIRLVGVPRRGGAMRPSDRVVTNRGTNSSGFFSRGNNFPATAVPHGFNFWTPVTNAGSTSWLYEYARMNNMANLPALQAFSVSHEPSPWMGERQTFQVMPSPAADVPDASRMARALPFRHENEIARAHYYSVRFENGIKTEITPTDHAALFRFTFPDDNTSLIFDNVNNMGGLTLDPVAGVVTGFSDVRSGLSAGATRLFVYATFDKPVTASGKLAGGGGADVTGYFRFGGGRVVTMRIATSLLSVDQARRNLAQEISAGDTFEKVRDRAQKQWDDKLRVIEVEGATPDQLTTLYSNLYRLYLYPNSGFENTGTPAAPVYKYASPFSPAAGPNTPTETGAKVVMGKAFVNNGFWDTYRTSWPAYALLTPKKAGEMIDGFVQQYKDGGWVARWSSPGYANLMTGTSSDVAFADAYLKGVTNFDVRAAYDAALKNATVTPPNMAVGRKGLNTSQFLGYTSTATDEGMSWALEGYINDYGIATMAKKLYDTSKSDDPRRQEFKESHEYFLNRAVNYVQMYNPSVKFFMGRDLTGKWRLMPDRFDPRNWGDDYTETNAWNFAFHAPQDGQGLANLYGGREALEDKLDAFFSTPETAGNPGGYGGIIHEMLEARDVRMGQYGHSNQVSHHIPYMYNYTGKPWKTQEKVRDVLARLYTGSEIGQGYPGDEDNGEMSAWHIFSALGFYPLQMGSPSYAIGSPLFTKATVNLENGKKLVVKAPKNSPKNVYVQGLKVNGKAHSKTHLSHDLLVNGATLEFDMGSKPSAWGSGTTDVLPSITKGTEAPRPLEDLTGPNRGTATAAPEGDANMLFDNTTATSATWNGATPWAQYALSGEPEKATFYTITSGAQAGDPKNWVLKGSYDGRNWTVIDKRSNQAFQWRLQTRSFKIEKPGRYAFYSFEVLGNTGQATTSIAEIEFLAKPAPACTTKVTGKHNGALTVSSGVTCVRGATVNGPVTVRPGASLYVTGGSITGPVTATDAATVVLTRTTVGGEVIITGTSGEAAVEGTKVAGAMQLLDNAATIVAGSGVAGPLTCLRNAEQPVNNGLSNKAVGTPGGQCAGL